ncbi:hypothetical protein LP52_18790 [Streptomonospora alba]|uniref:Uncharacterized protein n=1 Tax=Streptomonospora alba TaxID=183763 RepID=A0A0C2J7P4_9ACTN|nr:hypothetical protein [Streptomonospora alba]KIH97481.1 hypothetical protein LP52_18790 [Streptomonospora alba]
MSTPHGTTPQRTRWLITVLVVLVMVLALALAMAVGYALGSGGTDEAASRPSSSPSPSGSGGPIRLSGGSAQVDGRYPVKFARTPEGAVSALAAFNSSYTTLDPAVKARAGQLYMNEMRNMDMRELTEGMRANIDLELESYGFGMTFEELPTQASMSALPLGAVYERVDARRIDVALLVRISAYDGISRRTEFLVTPKARCIWMEDVRDGDWMMADDFPKIEAPEKAEPHTAAFENSEWTELQGGVP